MNELEAKFGKLTKFVDKFNSILVAFSGGVDSSTLAAVCHERGKEVVAVTVHSPLTPSRELKRAREIAREIGIKHEILRVNPLENEKFVKNDNNRCYYCKKFMIENLLKYLEEKEFEVIFEGTNASDLKKGRPGYKAIKESRKVFSPWAECGFTKEEIRSIAKRMGFTFYNEPSLACLATRIPTNTEIEERALAMVDMAENVVIDLAGVRQVRVRKLGDIAVIEVGKEEIFKLLDSRIFESIVKELKVLGFVRVLIDMEGYEEGKGNLTM